MGHWTERSPISENQPAFKLRSATRLTILKISIPHNKMRSLTVDRQGDVN